MKYLYAFIIIFLCTNLFCQDTIVMRDNSKLIAKVLEISTTEVKYKRFDNIDGPDYEVSKNDVSSITYSNGLKDMFEITKINSNADNIFINPTPPKGNEKRETKVGDYIKINTELGAIANESYCNKPYRNTTYYGGLGSPEDITYTQPGKKYTNLGASTGLNILFGKSPVCKHLIGLNYTNSKGEFALENYKYYYDPNTSTYTQYYKNTNYRSTIHFLNIATGIRFILFKKISLDNTFLINVPVYAVNKQSGYEQTITGSYGMRNVSTSYLNNTTTHDSKVGVTISFTPKITYEFYDFNRKVGVYFAYNMSFKYNLPWWMFGITYYPFKKLR